MKSLQMKSFLAIIAISFGLCFLGSVSAQSFNGFEMNTTAKHLQEVCTHQKGGTWSVVPRHVLPTNPPRITSGAECHFKQQTVKTRPDGSIEFITPNTIFFTFDHVGLVEFMVFRYGFRTWAARDHAISSMRRDMNVVFPLTAKKLEVDEYKLNNLPYYVTFMNIFFKELENPFQFSLALSRERFKVYRENPPKEKATLDDLDLQSSDPLTNL